MVKNPTQKDVPAFYSPLTHEQHAQLGRISLLWGQVDTFVDQLLTAVLHGMEELRSDMFRDKPIGKKLDFLTTRIRDKPDAPEKQLIEEFIAAVHSVKSERNACFHGAWGFRIGRKKVEAAAQHHKASNESFNAERLPKLERRLCQISHLGRELLEELGLLPVLPEGAQPLFHGDDPTQEWFQEWLEQHRSDCHSPDHRWKPGRLPFLERPLG